MKCVRIGYGHIAYWHEKKLKELGVETIGIIEKNLDRCFLAKYHGFRVLSSYKEAFEQSPVFWDICTCTSSHIEIIKNILEVSPNANILVEKPICLLSQIGELKEILRYFKGKIVVNENYQSSCVTQVVRQQIDLLGLNPTRIISEMSKNRSKDIINGRFLDEEHFAFGYEGTHMITNVLALGEDYEPAVSCGVSYQDMYVRYPTHTQHLPKQGSVQKCYLSKNNTKITLYTSMDGKIGFTFPHSPYKTNYISVDDAYSRYRILAVKDDIRKLAVVGYYEPVINLPRATGMVMILENNELTKCISPIRDDNIHLSIQQAVNYFAGKGKNPYSVLQAIKTLQTFQLWKKG